MVKATMLNEIKKALQTLESAFGTDIFEQPGRFKSALYDVKIDADPKIIRNLLCIAVCDLKAYSRLKEAFADNNMFAVDNISGEMSSDFMIDRDVSRAIIECVAVLLEYKPQKTPEIGSIIPFGGYNWLVLEIQNDKALILCDKITEKRTYNQNQENVTWETCTLRSYLNGALYNKFSPQDKARIIETRITTNDNPWYDIKGGSASKDRIFLLSIEEVIKYFGDSGGLKNHDGWYWENDYVLKDGKGHWINDQYNKARIAINASGMASWWWLRSHGFFGFNAAFIDADGCLSVYGYNVTNNDSGGVRPALWLNL